MGSAKTKYNIITKGGRAKPEAVDPATYTDKVTSVEMYELSVTFNVAPYGGYMRPNSECKGDLIQRFRGQYVVVY
jgi:hypothetical protein